MIRDNIDWNADWTRTGVTHVADDGKTYAQELHVRCDYEYHERWVEEPASA